MAEGKPVRVTGDAVVRVKAEKPYKNGMNAAGLPPWREGEIREITLRDLKQLQDDSPGNWTLDTES
jgi:hypothetical protein